MNVQRIELELSKETIPGQSVRIGQGDSSGTTIEAHIYDNGVAVPLGEMAASFCMRTPSGNAYVRDSSCTVSGNVVTYVVDESKCCAVSGKTHDAYFELSSDPYTYSTSRFLLVIMEDVSNGSDPAATWDSEFDKWMARKDDEYDQTIADKLEAVDEALDAMGDISELAVPTMSASTKGGAKLGTGLEVDQDNKLNVTPASTSSLGGVKADGETITADADGTIHGAYQYTLPTMGVNTKGGAKLGTGLSVDQNGALNVNVASASALGGVKPDGTTITADNDGTIHGAYQYTLPTMTDEVRGGAKVGDGLSVDQDERLNIDPLTTAEIDTVAADGNLTSSKVLNGTRLTYLWGKLKAKFAALVDGVVAVSQGGTGKDTHTSNAVLTGNGTSAVNNVATASGALYATEANGAASFGTLPVAQGGTGATTAAAARTNLDAAQSNGATGTLKAAEGKIDNLEASIAPVESVTATANHAIGDYFMLGNVLMRATSAIAIGEQITVSNATPATLQGQIDTLRDSVSTKLVGTQTKNGIAATTYRCGKVVMVRLYGAPTTAISDWMSFDTRVPVPPDDVVANYASSGGNRYTVRVLSTNGELAMYPRGGNFPTSETVNTFITYLA